MQKFYQTQVIYWNVDISRFDQFCSLIEWTRRYSDGFEEYADDLAGLYLGAGCDI